MLRSYRTPDEDAVVDIWREASLLAHPFLSPRFMDEEEIRIRRDYLPATDTWVWEDRAHLAGFISLIGNEVGAIFVRPSLHRQGIGRALMDKALGLHECLEVEVFEANPIGLAFYLKYGFAPIGKSVHGETGQSLLRLRFGNPT